MNSASLCLLVLWMQAAVPSGPGEPSAQLGAIRGTVVDRDSGRPLARAIVDIGRRDQDLRLSTRTDAQGAFEFAELQPGRYWALGQPGEHRGTHLVTVLDGDSERIDVKSGETRQLRIELRRALAITVRVVDESGEPLAGFNVMVRKSGTGDLSMMRMRFTDDRGHLRVHGLSPGSYTVCAERMTMGSSAGLATSARERLLRTCHPGSSLEADAQTVRLVDSDVGPIEIRMRRGRTFSISGTVVGSSNPAAGLRVELQRFENGGSSSSFIRVGADGRFDIVDVPPGVYAIGAHSINPERPDERSSREAAFLPIDLVDDIKDLVIPLARTVDVRGSLRIDDESVQLPRPGGSGLMVLTQMAGPPPAASASWEPGYVAPDRTFALRGLFGARRIGVANLPSGWFVKSIRYDGRDITDEAVDFKADRGQVEILVSNRGAVVTGRVMDDRGNPLRGSRVLLFKADRDITAYEPYVDGVASDDGRFRLGPQRGGDYVVVALAPGTPIPMWREHERLAALRSAGERITLPGEGEITIDLTAQRK